ncbi:MAG TPA: hypothetical protein VFS08_16355 [Gemmatimonadaceae bacterium]|nr:hypothetical protein [Gemmatimonadaceae bacterium]
MLTSWHQFVAWLDARSTLQLVAGFATVYAALALAERRPVPRLGRWWRAWRLHRAGAPFTRPATAGPAAPRPATRATPPAKPRAAPARRRAGAPRFEVDLSGVRRS